MAEVLVEFDEPVVGRDGTVYYAYACGGEVGDGTTHWHGWVEFAPVEGGTTIRTPRETTQPDRDATAWWATGLTRVYLEGALQRALWALAAVDGSSSPAFAPDTRRSPGPAPSEGRRRRAGKPARPRAFGAREPAPRGGRENPRPGARPAATGFKRVGGMEGLKTQVRRIIETIHLRQEDARRYGIVRNGILLYGPPGCGKTFFAGAMAEEYGLRLLHVPLGRAVSKYVGGAPEAIEGLFQEARSKTPCLLFFDEFDAVASRRRDAAALHEQQMVDALLQQLDAHRDTPGLLIVAATNRFEDLDPAVIREGRFDYKVRIDNPDFDARLAILRVVVGGRPHARQLRLRELAHDLDGFSAAQIRSLVDEAALAALEADLPIRAEHLRAAYRAQVAASRYGGRRLGWDELILPDETKRQLQLVQQLIENPQLTRELGVTPPTGILLTGPPGIGKTTIARVLASETNAAFFAVTTADILSKWVGEPAQRVQQLFARARAKVPSIVFLDELDALADRRLEADSAGDRVMNTVVNMLLVEMDGLDSSTRVFVIGATNRPELIDQALLRPGRLGERIDIPPPDAAGRRAMLELFSKRMRLAPSVDLQALAARTDGVTGAFLKGLCARAGRNALVRELDARGLAPAGAEVPAVTQEDFEKALQELLARDVRRSSIGFRPEKPPTA